MTVGVGSEAVPLSWRDPPTFTGGLLRSVDTLLGRLARFESPHQQRLAALYEQFHRRLEESLLFWGDGASLVRHLGSAPLRHFHPFLFQVACHAACAVLGALAPLSALRNVG